jgi:hypothetical protein
MFGSGSPAGSGLSGPRPGVAVRTSVTTNDLRVNWSGLGDEA